jgi:L-ascorbate metabolism protein UlaG (beta-lactamase superfamily)
MNITKFDHSCLLVETDDRTVLFDPGVMSTGHIDIDSIERLDDIFITHAHPDHVDAEFVKKLIDKFPTVRITTTGELADKLNADGIKATTTPPGGVEFFDSPHESVKPLYPQPEEIGIHYLNTLTHPGDSHSFKETKAILAIPFTAPWGANIKALNLALELKPQHVLPIHDWHWKPEALAGTYDSWVKILGEQGITFHKLETGVPVEITV